MRFVVLACFLLSTAQSRGAWKQSAKQRERACAKAEAPIEFGAFSLPKDLRNQLEAYKAQWKKECRKPVIALETMAEEAKLLSDSLCKVIEKRSDELSEVDPTAPVPAEDMAVVVEADNVKKVLEDTDKLLLFGIPLISVEPDQDNFSNNEFKCTVAIDQVHERGENSNVVAYNPVMPANPCNSDGKQFEKKLVESKMKERSSLEGLQQVLDMNSQWRDLCHKKSQVNLTTVFGTTKMVVKTAAEILNGMNSYSKAHREIASEISTTDESEHYSKDELPEQDVSDFAKVLSKAPGSNCVWQHYNFKCEIRYTDFYSYAAENNLAETPYYDLLAREIPQSSDESSTVTAKFAECRNFGTTDWTAKFELWKKATTTSLYKADPAPIDSVLNNWKQIFLSDGRICTCGPVKTYKDDIALVVDFLENQSPVDEALVKDFKEGLEKLRSGEVLDNSSCGS